MNFHIRFQTALLIKQLGFDLEVEHFFTDYGNIQSLSPYRDYTHLGYNGGILDYDFNGKYNWNAVNVPDNMVILKTAYNESDEYGNTCVCSAPTIGDVINWLYIQHKIWVSVNYVVNKGGWFYTITYINSGEIISNTIPYTLPNIAYDEAFGIIKL